MAFVPAPANPKSSGSSDGGGSSWVSTALTVAGTVLALLGDDPQLNDAEIEILVTGSAIVSDILPLFPGDLPIMIEDRMSSLIEHYS